MKKIIALLLALTCALALFAGCAAKTTSNDTAADTSAADTAAKDDSASTEKEDKQDDAVSTKKELSGTVATDGSTSMEKVIGALGESFMAENPNVTFTYNPTGSGSGIQAVSEGRCDIGLSSRALKDEEKASGLKETTLALDGIAIIVNPENPVSDLDVETIAKIYTGEITNWKDVGGNDAEIVLIGREAGSGTRDGFESGYQGCLPVPSGADLHRRRDRHGRAEPGRHRLCLPLRSQGHRQGSDCRRRGPERRHRQGRQLCRAETVRPRHEGRRGPQRSGPGVL